MADGAEITTTTEPKTPAAVVTPPADPPAVTPPAVVTPPAAKTAATVTPSKDPPAGPKEVTIKDDEDVPPDAELIKLSSKQLTKRLERHSKSELKAAFGTDSVDEIKAKLAKVAELEAKEEAERIAKLSEIEKANERATKAEKERDEFKSKWEADRADQEFKNESKRMESIVSKSIDAGMLKYALPELAAHLRATYTTEELDALEDGDIEKWATKFATDNPKFAKATDDAPAPKVVTEKKLTNGPNTAPPVAKQIPGEAGAGGKTMKPGQPNSMTASEARAQAGQKGYRW